MSRSVPGYFPLRPPQGCASVQNSSGPSDGGGEQLISRKRGLLSVLALLVAVLALVAAGCGGDDESSSGGTTTGASGGSGGNIEALPSSSCTAVEYKGEGDPDVLLASDFPLQGSSRTQTIQIVEAIRYLLEQSNFKAGDHK